MECGGRVTEERRHRFWEGGRGRDEAAVLRESGVATPLGFCPRSPKLGNPPRVQEVQLEGVSRCRFRLLSSLSRVRSMLPFVFMVLRFGDCGEPFADGFAFGGVAEGPGIGVDAEAGVEEGKGCRWDGLFRGRPW